MSTGDLQTNQHSRVKRCWEHASAERAEVKSQRLGKRGCPGELKDVHGWSRVCERVQDAVGVSGLEEALDGRGLGEPSSSQMLAHRCGPQTSPDQQHQHHPGPCLRCKFLDSAPDLTCQRF